MKFKLTDIRSNPFRDIDNYPIDDAKIDALKASIDSTSFWDNLVAREIEGGAEIAYGHHRLKALGDLFPPEHEIDLIVRDLDDATMLRIMADENMQEWTSSAAIEQETIAAVVRAYGAGKITLPEPRDQNGAQVRHAPRFVAGEVPSERNLTYSAQTVADFLRWPVTKVQRALTALAAIEAEEVPAETFRGLGSTLSERVVQAAHVAEKRAVLRGEAPAAAKKFGREVATQLADDFRSGGGRAIGTAITDRRDQIIETKLPVQKRAAFPWEIARDIARDIEQFWTNGVKVNDRMISRREAVRIIAANQNDEGIRHYGGTYARALSRMAVEAEALASLFDKSVGLEEVVS